MPPQTITNMGAQVGIPQKRKILVLGGTGLLGRPLVTELVRRGFSVAVLGSTHFLNLHPDIQGMCLGLNAKYTQLDVLDDMKNKGSQTLATVIRQGFQMVINLIVDRGGTKWDNSRVGLVDNPLLNTNFPHVLQQIATQFQVPLIHLSTEYVWSGDENGEDGYPAVGVLDDRRIVGERGTAFQLQKRAAEERCSRNPWVTIVRLPVLYGNMLGPFEDEIVGKSIENFLDANDWRHDVWQPRYLTSAMDAAFIVGALAQKRLTVGLTRPVYHYGSQKGITMFDFMQFFSQVVRLDREVFQDNASQWPEESRPPHDMKLNIDETRKELGADWREPAPLDTEAIEEVWLPHFQQM